MLKIIVNSSNNIEIDEVMKQEVAELIEPRLRRFADRLTRAEVYVEDETSNKRPQMDKRCMMEVRPEGMHTLNVTEHGPTVHQAVKSATQTMERMLDDAFGRLDSINDRARRADNLKDDFR